MEKRRILLADDSKLFLEMQRTFLNRDSFELAEAQTGKEAVESSVKMQPHLILLSFTLPDMSGDEVCMAIKKDFGFIGTKVVVVTDDTSEETLTKCVDAGCDGLITKPFDKEEVLETVQKLLGETFRRKPRYRIHLPCAVYLEKEGVPGIMLDISEIGCRIAAEEFLDKDTLIDVGFTLPDTEQPVKWKGIVRWSASQKGDAIYSVVGVEFTDAPVNEIEMLQDILTSLPGSSRL